MIVVNTIIKKALIELVVQLGIGLARGDKRYMPPKCSENIVILCFERRFVKQNSVIRLKSSILAHQILGLATPLQHGSSCTK